MLNYRLTEDAKGDLRSVCGVDIIYYRVVDDTVEIIGILSHQDFQNLL